MRCPDHQGETLSGMPLEVFEAGGILSVLRKRVKEERDRQRK
jgi:hypothetical protein